MGNPFTVPNRINGIDITPSLQGKSLDAKKVKSYGFEFVYIQCSRYSSTRELAYMKTRDQCLEAGLKVGAYHFCSHDSDPVKQMEFFFRACEGIGSKPGELPPLIDWEHCTPSVYKNHPQHCVGWLETALGTAQELWYPNNYNSILRRYVAVYTYPNYASGHQPALGQQEWIGVHPLCYASYRRGQWMPTEDMTHCPEHGVPKPWLGPRLWQYSGDGGLRVPGIEMDCDRQLFNGSSGEWQDFLGVLRPPHETVKDA
jgi:GH25 family lysozyme M1 (1,4-beta-N-acetylmuramidase)